MNHNPHIISAPSGFHSETWWTVFASNLLLETANNGAHDLKRVADAQDMIRCIDSARKLGTPEHVLYQAAQVANRRLETARRRAVGGTR